MDEPALWRAMGEAAQQHLRSVFNRETGITALEEVYRKALRPRGSPEVNSSLSPSAPG